MKYWTIEKQQVLVNLYAEGKKVTEIAEELEMPRSVVAGLLHSLGVVKKDGYAPKQADRGRFPYSNYYSDTDEKTVDYDEQ